MTMVLKIEKAPSRDRTFGSRTVKVVIQLDFYRIRRLRFLQYLRGLDDVCHGMLNLPEIC